MLTIVDGEFEPCLSFMLTGDTDTCKFFLKSRGRSNVKIKTKLQDVLKGEKSKILSSKFSNKLEMIRFIIIKYRHSCG